MALFFILFAGISIILFLINIGDNPNRFVAKTSPHYVFFPIYMGTITGLCWCIGLTMVLWSIWISKTNKRWTYHYLNDTNWYCTVGVFLIYKYKTRLDFLQDFSIITVLFIFNHREWKYLLKLKKNSLLDTTTDLSKMK